MPTVHFVKKKSLNEINLKIPWSIKVTNGYSKKRKYPSTDTGQSSTQPQTETISYASLDRDTNTQHCTLNRRVETNSKSVYGQNSTTATARVGIPHLVRKSDEPILVLRSGTKEEQFAYELYNPHDDDPDNNQVWIEWLTTQQKVCIYRSEIVKNGLKARTRQKPNRFL